MPDNQQETIYLLETQIRLLEQLLQEQKDNQTELLEYLREGFDHVAFCSSLGYEAPKMPPAR